MIEGLEEMENQDLEKIDAGYEGMNRNCSKALDRDVRDMKIEIDI